MGYKISFTFEANTLTCEVHGKRTLADSKLLWSDILNKIKTKPVSFILLDLHLTGRLQPEEILKSVGILYPKLLQKNIQVLVVDNNPDSYHDNYLSSILVKEKQIPVQLFKTAAEAKLWLSRQ